MRSRSRTAGHVAGGFYSVRQVDAVRPQFTHASFYSASRMPEHSLRRVLNRQLLRRQRSDFKDGGCHCFDLRYRWSLLTLPCPPCAAPIGDLLLNGFSSGLDCASWTMGGSCAVTCTEGYQAANGTSGTLTCTYNEVAGCGSGVRLTTRQRVSATRAVTSRIRAVVWPLAQRVMKLGSISTTSSRCLSSGEFCQRCTNCLSVVFAVALL